MTTRSKFGFLALAAVACLAFTGVQAGGYVGASAGQGSAQFEPDPGSPAFDSDATAYKIHGGYRVMKFFGVEADYRDFGSPSQDFFGTEVQVDTTAFDLFAVGVIPIGMFELFGKAGYSKWDAEISASGLGSLASDDGNDLAYGIGAAFAIGKFALRVEYEQFDIENTDDISMASVGVDFRF